MATENIELGRKLGHGAFGSVFESVHNGKRVAVKLISTIAFPTAAKEEARKCFKLLQVSHKNIIEIFRVTVDLNHLYIFMELCELGDLNRYIFKTDLTTVKKVGIMSQIMEGIEFLHSKNIIHRDLKPRNVLIQSEGGEIPVVKLADFGLSKFLGEGESSSMSSDVGTRAYKAPEYWMKDGDGNLHYRRRVDVFAAGLTFLAILQAQIAEEEGKSLCPYIENVDSLDRNELIEPIGHIMYSRSKFNRKIPDFFSCDDADDLARKVKVIIKKMIEVKAENRPYAAEVKADLIALC